MMESVVCQKQTIYIRLCECKSPINHSNFFGNSRTQTKAVAFPQRHEYIREASYVRFFSSTIPFIYLNNLVAAEIETEEEKNKWYRIDC